MNGVHDLGGMHGFGPIEREENEPTFHADWEARVWAMQRFTRAHFFNVDAFRHGIERMDPAHYLRSSYYERWLDSITRNLIDIGVVTADELDTRTEMHRQHPGGGGKEEEPVIPSLSRNLSERSGRPLGNAGRLVASPPPVPPAPRFAVGDIVVTRNVHTTGHTRLPRYARGKRGVIQRLYGPQIFPDTNAHGLGEQPQPLYNVRFEARELWGESAEPRQTVALDLWDSYLDPAPA